MKQPTFKLLWIGIALTAVVQLAIGWFPQTLRLWGINHLGYFPLPFRILFAIFIVVLLFATALPFISASVSKAFEKIFSSNNSNWLSLVAAVLSLPLFWYLKSSTQLLGDGQVLVNNAAVVKPTTSLMEIVTMALQTRTPLSTVIYFLTAQYGQAWFGLSKVALFQGISCITGAAYVYSVIWFANKFFKEDTTRTVAIGLLLFQGGIELYFGYIEYYTLFHLAVFLYCAFAILSLHSERSLVVPTIILFCAVGLHFLGVLLIPSYLFLVAQKKGVNRVRQLLNARGVLFLLAAMVCLFAVAYFFTGEYQLRRNFLPLQSLDVTISYTVFSRSHLVDFANLLLLISPAALVIVVGVIFLRAEIDWNEPALLFLLLAAACSLGFAFMANTDIGFARDWDVMLCMSSTFVLFAASLAPKLFAGDSRISVLVGGASFLFVLPWVLLNAGENASVSRFEHLLTMDRNVIGDYRTAYGYEMLSIHFREYQAPQHERNALARAIEASNNIRFYENLVVSFNRSGVSTGDTALLTVVVDRLHGEVVKEGMDRTQFSYKDHLNLYFVSLRFMRELGLCHATERYYEEAIKADVPDIGYARIGLGQCYAQRGDFVPALAQYEQVRLTELQIVPRDLQFMAQTYFENSQFQRSKEIFEMILAQSPKDEEAMFGAGMSLFKLRQYDSAQAVFERYRAQYPVGRHLREFKYLLRR